MEEEVRKSDGLAQRLKSEAEAARVGDEAREWTREEGLEPRLCAAREMDEGEGTTRSRSEGTAPCRRIAVVCVSVRSRNMYR